VNQRRTVGSDMPSVEHSNAVGDQALPWQTDEPIVYAETGRQILRHLSDGLWKMGRRELVLPDFLCESMILPFSGHAWKISTVSVDADYVMQPRSLVQRAKATREPFVVLTAAYFGRQPDAELVSAVGQVQEAGGFVIDDETHRILDPLPIGADVAIASLRKLLPLADGAYLRGWSGFPSSGMLPPRELRRWQAMDDKRAETKASEEIYAGFVRGNEELEAELELRSISNRSRLELSSLDYKMMALTRCANAEILSLLLAGIEEVQIVNIPDSRSIPSHLLVRSPDPSALQKHLAAAGIFCPIHWPATDLLHRKAMWPKLSVSMPIDHRYDARDMHNMAHALKEYFSHVG